MSTIEERVRIAFEQVDRTGEPAEVLGDDGKRVMLIVKPSDRRPMPGELEEQLAARDAELATALEEVEGLRENLHEALGYMSDYFRRKHFAKYLDGNGELLATLAASREPEPAGADAADELTREAQARGEYDMPASSRRADAPQEPGASHDATPECAHGVSREYNCLLCIAEEHGHAAAVKAIAEWIRNPHEGAENHWTPSWVADAIERGEPFRPRAGK